MTTPTRPKLGYRPDLDGIRAIAVALVVIGHLNWPMFNHGGTIGVTLFFVLSGFLITTLLLEERERMGRIDLLAFWRRRAYRLLPASMTMILVTLIVAAVRGEVDDYVGRAAAVTFYVANWVQSIGGPDFGMLNHTWSLAVEEQFYLIWPPILAGVLAWRGHRTLAVVIGSLAALSLAARVTYAAGVSPHYIYRATDSIAVILLIGCASALLWTTKLRHRTGNISHLVPLIGLAGILVMASLRFHVQTLPAAGVFGALLVVGLTCRPGMLAWAPLVWLGRISYSLYLWHFIIIRGVLDYPPYVEPDLLVTAIAIPASIAVAAASYYLIEQPFQRYGRRRAARAEV